MWKRFFSNEKPQLKDPSLIVALSTSLPQYVLLYSQARELARFILNHLDFRLFATLYCDAMSAEVLIVPDGTAHLPRTEFYYLKGKRDIVLCAGDSSPLTENYEFADAVLSFAESIGVKEVISIGARFVEPPSPSGETQVLGFASDLGEVEKLRKLGVAIQSNEPSPYFSSVIVGLAKIRGMKAYKLSTNHGEPRPHPKSVLALLKVISRILEFSIDLKDLEEMTKVMALPTHSGQEEPGSAQRRDENIYG